MHHRGKEYVSFIIPCNRIWFGSDWWSYWYSNVPRTSPTARLIVKTILFINEVIPMSVLLFPVIAFGMAVVVGRVGTLMFQTQEEQA